MRLVVRGSQTAESIHNLVRGFQPWPGAHTTFRGQMLHVWRSRVTGSGDRAAPGRIASVKPLAVTCGEGGLELLDVQLEGRKRISAADFANGQRLIENEILGAS